MHGESSSIGWLVNTPRSHFLHSFQFGFHFAYYENGICDMARDTNIHTKN